jgi:hypothetical protein
MICTDRRLGQIRTMVASFTHLNFRKDFRRSASGIDTSCGHNLVETRQLARGSILAVSSRFGPPVRSQSGLGETACPESETAGVLRRKFAARAILTPVIKTWRRITLIPGARRFFALPGAIYAASRSFSFFARLPHAPRQVSTTSLPRTLATPSRPYARWSCVPTERWPNREFSALHVARDAVDGLLDAA